VRKEILGYMLAREGLAPQTAKSGWKKPLDHPKRPESPAGGVMGRQIQRRVLNPLHAKIAVVVRHAETQPAAGL
jgi:hypothetical protein